MLGITTAEEQSKAPFVFILMMVGTPAFALLTLGEYPPLAVMDTICFPSSMVTLFADSPEASF